MNILGIDLSLNATGLALLSIDEPEAPDVSPFPIRKYMCQSIPGAGPGKEPLWYQGGVASSSAEVGTLSRWESVLLPIMAWAEYAHVVLIEGYAFSRNLSYTRATTEFGGIVRYHLRKMDHVPIEISPSSLKKFVTGSGAADKTQILAAVRTEFDVAIADHNMADAFGLTQVGRAMYLADEDVLSLQRWQREVIAVIKYPEEKGRKTRAPKLKFEGVST